MPKSLSYFYYNTWIHKIPMLFFKIVKVCAWILLILLKIENLLLKTIKKYSLLNVL